MYNWESSAKAGRKKVKKTGTVVLHSNDDVEPDYARLLKEVVISKRQHHSDEADEEGNEVSEVTVRSALMSPETAARLKEVMRFDSLLPCQAQCYRGIFNRRDVILHSRTGSGKTLAYALPIIERHLLLGAKEETAAAEPGPFLLVFVFSNDLAVQTKGVLANIYPSLRVGVAGFDPAAPYDILIGTVRKLDECIRGHKVAAAATALEEKEKAEQHRLLGPHDGGAGGKKRPRAEAGGADAPTNAEEEEEEDVDEDGDDGAAGDGDISVARVRAIVIDEVDTTLGPRFSNVGRRVKNLLRFVRRANGSLTEGLLSDFRAHHYVLCGATIPNWVIKAGFLGVKKYYYQLVTVGTEKLPSGLSCYELACPLTQRVEVAVELLTGPQRTQLGRVVVFGTNKQIAAMDAALHKANESSNGGADDKGSSPAKKKAKSAGGPDAKGQKDGAGLPVVARVLTPSKDESERIASMDDFNKEVASVLLCTDIAARGLDFTAVDTVLMLSVPQGNMAAETFVHRAGRTARVSRTGQCILMCDASEAEVVNMIVKTAHVVFKKYLHTPASASVGGGEGKKIKAGAGSGADQTTRFQLTVRNQLKFSRPDVKVPSAREVLERSLEGDEVLRAAALKAAEEVGATREVVCFSVPAAVAHEVKQKLWKYNLKEVSQ